MNFILADRRHDAELRRVLREAPVPGSISVAYEREPSFFDSLESSGTQHQVIAAMEGDSLVGMGCRSIDKYWVNDKIIDFGYLSGLRSLVGNKLTRGLARAYQRLRQLHEEAPVAGYLTTIIDDNERAKRILTSGRIGLPTYADFGCYNSFLINLNRFRRCAVSKSVRITQNHDGVDRFWEHEGPKRQFFPVRHCADFGTGCSILVARNGDDVIGTVVLQDQSAHKQHRVTAYSPALRLSRPFLNLALQAAGFQALPPVGGEIRTAYASMVCIHDDQQHVLEALVNAAYERARENGFSFLCLGLHDSDPLLPLASTYQHVRYRSRLYVVDWRPEDEIRTEFAGRTPYLEPAAL